MSSFRGKLKNNCLSYRIIKSQATVKAWAVHRSRLSACQRTSLRFFGKKGCTALCASIVRCKRTIRHRSVTRQTQCFLRRICRRRIRSKLFFMPAGKKLCETFLTVSILVILLPDTRCTGACTAPHPLQLPGSALPED